jgi:hypothetical protein
VTRAALARAAVALAGAAMIAACGAQPARPGAPAPAADPVPLSTSLVTGQGTWAVAVMGGEAGGDDNFWQLFARPAGASGWSLVTPPGVADNGGLVAAAGAAALVVGFRPSQNLAFSPLATSTDAGRDWAPGLLDAGLADSPGAIAVAPSGRVLALLQDGSIQTAPTAGEAAAGRWTLLTTLRALTASAAGRECGLSGVTAISFGPDLNPVAAGGCARAGVAGVFTDVGGTWRSAGLALPGVFGRRPVRVLGLTAAAGGDVALLAAGTSVLAAWQDGARWTVSAPVAAGSVRALGFGGGRAWLLLGGGRAESIGAAGSSWQPLPPVPAGTQVLVPAGTQAVAPAGTQVPGPAGTQVRGPAGSGGSYEALAVDRNRLTVWRLAQRSWLKTQQLTVPIQYGSSG